VVAANLIFLAGFTQGADATVAADVTASSSEPTNAAPARPPRLGRSPVETFRKLLAMSPEERTGHVRMYPPGLHERMLAKLEEYQMLPEPYRELKLQVTELRWYLLPLLKVPVDQRASSLAPIPEPYRTWVADRLNQWDMMPPSLKDDMLEYESLLDRFVSGNVEVPSPSLPTAGDDEALAEEQKMRRWQALPLAQRQQIYGSLKRYLELSEPERNRTLQALSEPERGETARALRPIEQWPRQEQEQYIAAFEQYVEMSADERQRFLRNAQRWQQMSPAERQAWRDLVKLINDTPPAPPDVPATEAAGDLRALESRRTNPVVAAPHP
jgi:hypothetical protein